MTHTQALQARARLHDSDDYDQDKGKLAVTNTASGKKYADMLKAAPDLYGKVEVRLIDPPKQINFGPDHSQEIVAPVHHRAAHQNDRPRRFAAAHY